MSTLALIPARGGSKRVIGKNSRPLAGRPLIEYAIETAKRCPGVDRHIVSTDDPELAELARRAGAEVPFLRPAELAGDDTPDKPVARHAIEWLAARGQPAPDVIVWLRPTCPLRAVEDIEASLSLLSSGRFDSVRSVSRVQHHPYWMKRLGEDGSLSPLIDEHTEESYPRSQLLPPVYHLNGVVDCVRVAAIGLPSPMLFCGRMGGTVVPPERALDIDTLEDFDIAERLIAARSSM